MSDPTAGGESARRSDAPSDRNRVIAAELIARAWQDEGFKAYLLAEPKQALEAAGVDDIPPDVRVITVENTVNVKYLVMPDPELLPTYEPQVLQLVRASLPLPSGVQIRLIQNTSEIRYLVIPVLPVGAPGHLEASHVELLAAAGWEAINAYTTANAVAEVNAAAWANVAAATEAAAAAVAVAVIGVVLI